MKYETPSMKNDVARRQLAWKLSQGGRFQVLLVSYPQHPEIFEFIARSGLWCTRYINVDARPGANISQFLDGD